MTNTDTITVSELAARLCRNPQQVRTLLMQAGISPISKVGLAAVFPVDSVKRLEEYTSPAGLTLHDLVEQFPYKGLPAIKAALNACGIAPCGRAVGSRALMYPADSAEELKTHFDRQVIPREDGSLTINDLAKQFPNKGSQVIRAALRDCGIDPIGKVAGSRSLVYPADSVEKLKVYFSQKAVSFVPITIDESQLRAMFPSAFSTDSTCYCLKCPADALWEWVKRYEKSENKPARACIVAAAGGLRITYFTEDFYRWGQRQMHAIAEAAEERLAEGNKYV